jgi:hypothetical protein
MSAPLDLDGLDGCLRPVPVPLPVPVPDELARAAASDDRPAARPVPAALIALSLLGSALALGAAGAGFWALSSLPNDPEPSPAAPISSAIAPVAVAPEGGHGGPPHEEEATPRDQEPWTVRFAFSGVAPLGLDAAPDWLADCPRITVTGHTCDLGEAEANVVIGRVRAEAVRDRLVGSGLPADRFTVRSAGEAEPAAPNDSREARRANRRVVVACEP